MKVNRRRQRTPDPLANPDAVRAVLVHLRKCLPIIVPSSEKLTVRMLDAVRHVERRPAFDTGRGRPSRWDRKDLLRVAGQLRSILHRETKGRVSVNSFIGLYLRVLKFPKDITKALEEGDINLFEAAQLARLTAERLNLSTPEAQEYRREILRSHLLAQGSQSSLRSRIDDQLGVRKVQPKGRGTDVLGVTELVDGLLELDPYDTKHLFWEELRRIAFALREITPDDVDDKTLNELLSVSDRLSSILTRIQKRRRRSKK